MAKGEDSRNHPNRRVDRGSYLDRAAAQQQAMWKGVDAASMRENYSELDEEDNEKITHSQDTDEAPAHGIPRPSVTTPVTLYKSKNDFIVLPSEPGDNDNNDADADTPAEHERNKEHFRRLGYL